MESIVETLAELEVLLRQYNYARQADYLARLGFLYSEDRARFIEELNGPQMWGGAGSVVDVNLQAVEHEEAQAKRNSVRYMELVLQLVAELDSEGLASEEALSVSHAYSQLIEMGWP